MTLHFPNVSVSCSDHSLYTQCRSLVRLSRRHKKQRYLVQPLCCPKRKFTIFKFTQITQSCSWFFKMFNIILISLSFFFVCFECPTGTVEYSFPLSNRTHFRFLLSLSTKSLHSPGKYSSTPMHSKRPWMSWY